MPDHISLWDLRLAICQGLDQFANLRPSRLLPGVVSPLAGVGPGDLDWVIVRENSEGEYAGVGGRAHRGLPLEVGMDVSVMTRAGIERIMRFAFDVARARPRKLLTLVTKSNAQRHGMVLWDEVFEDVRGDYPDVVTDRMLVDAMTVRMVRDPASLDTIVATNLHADILSDLAAALSGSIGIAPTANLSTDPRGALDVRADPRVGLRSGGQGGGEPDRDDLVHRADARTAELSAGRRGADGRHRRCLGGRGNAAPRSGRQGRDTGGDGRCPQRTIETH